MATNSRDGREYIPPLSVNEALLAVLPFLAFGCASWRATWDYRAYFNLPESAQKVNLVGQIFFAILAVLMLGNALLACWRQTRHA